MSAIAPRVVLASTSSYRRALLERLGVPFDAVAPAGVDEDEAKDEEQDPERLARRLARAKADWVAAQHPDAVVIGSDQVAAVQDGARVRILSKPGTAERAVEQLLLLAGREMRLLTAVALVHRAGGRALEHLDEHRIAFRPFDRRVAEAYVERDRPLDCAGSFRLEGLGVALMERCRGDDATGVIGLPLIALSSMLEAMGVRVL